MAAKPPAAPKKNSTRKRPAGARPAQRRRKPASPTGGDLLHELIARARKAGADAADAILVESTALALAQRLGQPEKLERAESRDLGLRVFVGKRQAMVSSTDFVAGMLDELVGRAVAMAKSVPADPHCGLAEPAETVSDWPELDICDDAEPAPERLAERARAAEDAARSVAGVTNSEGAEAGWRRSAVSLVASNGFAGGYRLSQHSVGVSVIAGEGTGMQRDYEFSTAVHGGDLENPVVVGRRAGEKAVRRLNPRKAATAKLPVVYDPRVSGGLIGHLAGAINGVAIARGTSFLKDSLGARVMPPGVTVTDDPHRRRGLRSKPFDGEGIANRTCAIVEDGVLRTWLLDLRSARQLGLAPTGHAARGTSSPPSPATTNLYMEPGRETPEDLIGGILGGFYVTEMIGFGVNNVTGDYSRGAAGFWIEHGELTYPVNEVTVAGNLKEMFRNLTPANDLEFRRGTDAPTIRVDGMTVAGL